MAVGVSQDIAGSQMDKQQVLQWELGYHTAEIDHHRYVCQPAGFHRAIYRIPLRSAIVRHLDTDQNLRELLDAHGGELCVHIGQILFYRIAFHSRPDYVQEGQDSGSRVVDHSFLELAKILPAGASHVHRRSHAAAEGESIRRKSVGPAAVCPIRFDAVEDVHMNVDQAGRHYQPGNVYDLLSL